MKNYQCINCSAVIPVEDDYDTTVAPYCPCSLIVRDELSGTE